MLPVLLTVIMATLRHSDVTVATCHSISRICGWTFYQELYSFLKL